MKRNLSGLHTAGGVAVRTVSSTGAFAVTVIPNHFPYDAGYG